MLQQFIQRRPGYTIDGQEGADIYPVPGPEVFITDEGVEQSYVPAEDIRVMAQRLIEAYDQRFYFLQGEGPDKPAKFKIAYLWKAKGASSHGQLVLATCQKPGGLLAHFTDYHWVIVVNANHCRDQGLTRLQVEALVFHELCFPAGTQVAGPEAELGFTRWYTGPMVEIRTAAGHFLAGTPNHPILTDRGWVPLGLLQEGDHVFRCLDPQRINLMNPNEHQMPASIEQIAGSLSVPLRLMPPAAEDFHPDRPYRQIEIVGADGDLLAHLQTITPQPLGQLLFTGGDAVLVGFPGESHPFQRDRGMAMAAPTRVPSLGGLGLRFGRHPGHAESLGLMVIPGRQTMVAQDPNDRAGAHGELLGNSQHRGACPERGQNRSLIEGDTVELPGLAQRNPSLAHNTGDRWATSAELPADLLRGLAGPIERDDVVSIQVRPFSGHVYNLQTSSHWYAANGIIAHNCHCDMTEDGAPIMRPHDLEVFAAEIEEYGAWRSNIVPVAQAVQKRLPGIVDEGMGLPVGGA